MPFLLFRSVLEGTRPAASLPLLALLIVAALVAIGAVPARPASLAPRAPGLVLSEMTDAMPKSSQANVRVFKSTFQPGFTSEWHTHPSPPTIYVISGTATWEYKDGRKPETRHAGQAMMEPANVVLRLAIRGTMPAQLVLFQVSRPGDAVMRPSR